MDVQLPDGRLLKGVPDGTTKAQLAEKLQSNGVNVPPEWMSGPTREPPPQEGATTVDRAAAGAAGVNSGVAKLVGIPMSALVNLSNLASVGAGYLHSKITGEAPPHFYDPANKESVPFTSEWNVAHLGSAAEAPRPDDTASRYLHAAGEGATAAVAPGSAGARIPALLSGVSGATSQQVAAEAGASPAVQMAAGFAGSLAPSAGRFAAAESTKRILRGDEAGRQQVADNIATFKRAGIDAPSVGQVTEGRAARGAESFLAKVPGGAGRMAKVSEQEASNMGGKLEQLAGSLAPKASGEQAGRAITKGIEGGNGFIEKFKAKSTDNYNELDKYVKPADTFDVSNTKAALQKLTTPIKGAENTSGKLINPRIKAINDAMNADLAANNGVLPYKAVKELRTMIGDEMAGGPLGGDVPTAQWRKLYSALSADMEGAAAKSGPQAEAALARANSYHAAGMKRLDVLGSVVDKAGGPEAVFRAATNGTKEGATTIRAVMQSLPDDARKTVSATVLRRMGRATAGKQDDLGEKFSTETFLTNWNTISPQAKAVLFDRYGPAFRSDMDAVAKVASNLRDGSKVFVNPSGTGQAAAQISAGVGFITALVNGHPLAAAGVATGVAGAYGGARWMTSPKIVNWLAKSARAPKSAAPALINQAARSDDPDLRELASWLSEHADDSNDRGKDQGKQPK
jgi:hypothetical protein